MRDLIVALWTWLGANVAAIVASVALFIAVWEAVASRHHNRLSVRPALVLFTETNDEEFSFSLSVANTGFGSARIRSFTMLFDGAALPDSRTDAMEKYIHRMFATASHLLHVGYLNKGHVMATNERFQIIRIQFRDVKKDQAANLLKEMKRLDCVVEYESSYGEKVTLNTRESRGG